MTTQENTTNKEIELALKCDALLEEIARLNSVNADLRVSYTRLGQVAEQLQKQVREHETAEEKIKSSDSD